MPEGFVSKEIELLNDVVNCCFSTIDSLTPIGCQCGVGQWTACGVAWRFLTGWLQRAMLG
jgi:hypothetical protein